MPSSPHGDELGVGAPLGSLLGLEVVGTFVVGDLLPDDGDLLGAIVGRDMLIDMDIECCPSF